MEGRGMTEQKLARYRSTGVFFVMVTVVVVTALATFAAALRKAVSYSNDTSTPQLVSSADSVQVFQVNGVNNYEFMLSYIVAMALNFFVYYPIIGTIIFSGILTCGRFPVVGGRPFELKEEAVMALEEANDVEQTVSQKFKKSTIT